jgi:tRNA U34 2-thiouridine synthase MnmA/TrmU
VTDIDAASNAVTVGERGDLATSELTLTEVGFVHERPADGERVLVQYRAHGDVYPAIMEGAALRFETPVEAAAPGQSAALYSADDPDELLGGGIIETTVRASATAILG